MKNKKKHNQKKAPNVKCRLCGEIMKITKWRKHLEYFHNVGLSPRMKDFFIGCNTDLETAQKQWYNPDKREKAPIDYPCGTIVNGPPKVKIIYNPIFSNRKKF